MREAQELREEVRTLRRVAGLKNDEIDREVTSRMMVSHLSVHSLQL